MDLDQFFDEATSAEADPDATMFPAFHAADLRMEDLKIIRRILRLARNLHDLNSLLADTD